MEPKWSSSSMVLNRGWDRLWKLEIPPKVKNFIWRLCDGCLPIRTKLVFRGISSSLTCVFCDSDVEHFWHLFCECSFAKACWDSISIEFNFDQFINFQEWLLYTFQVSPKELLVKFTMILWNIWS